MAVLLNPITALCNGSIERETYYWLLFSSSNISLGQDHDAKLNLNDTLMNSNYE